MKNKFTWIPFYKELSDWLLGKQNSQPELSKCSVNSLDE